MKTKIVLSIIMSLFANSTLMAQEADSIQIVSGSDTVKIVQQQSDSCKDDGYSLSIGSGGVRISNVHQDSTRKEKKVTISYGMVDLGINALNDATNYSSAGAQAYLHVPDNQKNTNLFSLRQGKSINVNIWPVLLKIKLLNRPNQKISFYTGAGLQLYNFRFNKDISFRNDIIPLVTMDSVSFQKNKLAFSFASIPLMLNFKSRLVGSDLWLTYGFGVIGGYCLGSWTKQISEERGKQKNHDAFNFNKVNLSLSAEIGLNNYIRFYATYQVTNMYQNALVQHPYAIGIRFFGI